MSLAQLSAWCDARFGPHSPVADARSRPYDLPWVVMDNSDAQHDFGWGPKKRLSTVLGEIADHAERHAEWLELSGA